MKLFTIGFTKKSAEVFFTRLEEARVRRLVDVRLNNSSQLAGFAKKSDLPYFAGKLCGAKYLHLPELAPTQEILDDYKKRKGGWENYAREFLALMKARRIEDAVSRELLDHGYLLCSEEKPHHCHRRLVAEYLAENWGNVEIIHLP